MRSFIQDEASVVQNDQEDDEIPSDLDDFIGFYHLYLLLIIL